MYEKYLNIQREQGWYRSQLRTPRTEQKVEKELMSMKGSSWSPSFSNETERFKKNLNMPSHNSLYSLFTLVYIYFKIAQMSGLNSSFGSNKKFQEIFFITQRITQNHAHVQEIG